LDFGFIYVVLADYILHLLNCISGMFDRFLILPYHMKQFLEDGAQNWIVHLDSQNNLSSNWK